MTTLDSFAPPRVVNRPFRHARFPVLLALGLALASAGCTPTCPPDFRPVELPELMVGLSQTPPTLVPLANELGVRYARPTLAWREIEPTVAPLGLTVAELRAHPEWIDDYIASRNWSSFDAELGGMIAGGVIPVPIVGHGYVGALPRMEGSPDQPADPDHLGREEYLARIYRAARATVERYDHDGHLDAPGGLDVRYWQTENELNQAFLTALWGWRSPSLLEALGSAWQDFSFVSQILSTLRLAVKDADATALTTMNFHTDISDELMKFVLQPTWMESVVSWRMQMDFLGVDAYPNYYRATPVNGAAVGERVARVAGESCGMPIVVVETGYPTGPSVEGFGETEQADYVQTAFDGAIAAGARGFFLFGTQTAEQSNVEITPEDLANLELVADAYENGDVGALLNFLLFNVDYIESHFVYVLQAVEPFWGLVRADGSHKPAWDTYAAIAAAAH